MPDLPATTIPPSLSQTDLTNAIAGADGRIVFPVERQMPCLVISGLAWRVAGRACCASLANAECWNSKHPSKSLRFLYCQSEMRYRPLDMGNSYAASNFLFPEALFAPDRADSIGLRTHMLTRTSTLQRGVRSDGPPSPSRRLIRPPKCLTILLQPCMRISVGAT